MNDSKQSSHVDELEGRRSSSFNLFVPLSHFLWLSSVGQMEDVKLLLDLVDLPHVFQLNQLV